MSIEKNKPLDDLTQQGYTILNNADKDSEWFTLLAQHDIEAFHEYWNDLPPDHYLSDGGHYRFRRYSVFNWQGEKDELTLLPHEPHYQSTYRNNMNGGVYREYEPFTPALLEMPLLAALIQFVSHKISPEPKKTWRVQAHQFRIVANVDEAGLPTPEGIHRDGADFILIMVLKRHNIRGGVSHIYDENKRLIFGGILEDKEAVIVNDEQVWHGVSEVYPVDDTQEAYRDVLVLTFHHKRFL